jgi:putative transposase
VHRRLIGSVPARKRNARQSQHSGGQIIATSKEQELAANTIGVSDEFYRWKANVAGLDLSQATRLQALEDENAKLKKLLAERSSYSTMP